MYPIVEELVRDRSAQLEREAAAARLAATLPLRSSPRKRRPVRETVAFLGGWATAWGVRSSDWT